MTTPSCIEINRADSPLRHGLTAMPTEDFKAYQRHLASFTDEYDPQGATEANLV